jgi:hypothetical protein
MKRSNLSVRVGTTEPRRLYQQQSSVLFARWFFKTSILDFHALDTSIFFLGLRYVRSYD